MGAFKSDQTRVDNSWQARVCVENFINSYAPVKQEQDETILLIKRATSVLIKI
jgi:hypothetical protein